MNKQALIYESVRPVSKERHGNWRVPAQLHSYGFARGINAVPLTLAEFSTAALEFPIVFTKSGEGYAASALLGLRDDENLYVDDAGGWRARYVPAFLRRYPFVFAHDPKAETYTLCIDEASDIAGESAEGEPLFDDAGQDTKLLRDKLDFLKRWQRAQQDTVRFCDWLQGLDLFEDSQITYPTPDGQKAALRGVATIEREKIAQLQPDTTQNLMASGYLEAIYAHRLSLGHIEHLVKNLPAKPRVLN